MGWYKGKYVFSQRSFSKWFDSSKHKKDNYFRIRNRDQADVNVVKFVYSPNVVKNRRLYSPCATVYKHYLEYCDYPIRQPSIQKEHVTTRFCLPKTSSFLRWLLSE